MCLARVSSNWWTSTNMLLFFSTAPLTRTPKRFRKCFRFFSAMKNWWATYMGKHSVYVYLVCICISVSFQCWGKYFIFSPCFIVTGPLWDGRNGDWWSRRGNCQVDHFSFIFYAKSILGFILWPWCPLDPGNEWTILIKCVAYIKVVVDWIWDIMTRNI